MIFNLFLILLIGFEIQKLFQLNSFFRLKCSLTDYKKIITKEKSPVHKEFIKIIIVDFFYLTIIVIGLFSINEYFFCCILFLSVIQTIIFKIIKNKIIRKISYTIDIILSILLLTLTIINFVFYHLNGIKFIEQLINQFKI